MTEKMRKMKLAIIIGTRPEIIRASLFIKYLKKEGWIDFQVWFTGQHYDYELSTIFEEELSICPDRNFEIGSGSHIEQITKVMIETEKAILDYNPDMILLDGDTNSTFGAALSAKKLNVPIAHIESGTREQTYDGKTFHRELAMNNYPEELNRIIIDNCSELLFAPTEDAIKQLKNEHVLGKVIFAGDFGKEIALRHAQDTPKGDYTLVTIHRPENTDDTNRLRKIITALEQSGISIIFPMHPRTQKALRENGIEIHSNLIRVCEPVGYSEMIKLIAGAKQVLTDSAGVQREAFYLKTPCLTLRRNSTWVEAIACGADKLINCEDLIEELRKSHGFPSNIEDVFGPSDASLRIISSIKKWWRPVKPLFAVFSARDIPEMMERYNNIKCVDKVMFKYRSTEANLNCIEQFFYDHKEYTHLILNSDDAMPTNEQIAMIVADVEEYGFPIITGCNCQDKLHNDMDLNITLEPVTNVETASHVEGLGYKHLPPEFANRNMILKVWFEGRGVMCVRRDILEKIHLTYRNTWAKKLPQKWWICGDLAWSYICSEMGIPQYVDFRVYMEHSKRDQLSGEGKVFNNDEKEPIDTFEEATIEMPEAEPAPLLDEAPEDLTKLVEPLEKEYRILIGSLFCNEEHSIPTYIDKLLKIDYPKELIDVVWIENCSSDNTWDLLKYYEKILKKHAYHSIMLYQKFSTFGNLTKEKFGCERSGKVANTNLSWEARGNFHLSLHNFLFDQMTDEHDFVLFWFADSVPQNPKFLKRFIKDMECYPDAGWFGGVQYQRFPRHRRCHCGNSLDRRDSPWYYGLEAPYLKFTDLNDLVNTPANKKYHFKPTINGTNNWNIPYGYLHYWYYGMRPMGHPLLIRIIEEEEIEERQKVGKGIFYDICSTPHIFLIRKSVIRSGLRWRYYDAEASIAMDTDLQKLGYKMYCDSYVFFLHMSVDGQYWRNHFGPEYSEVEKRFMRENFGPEWTEKDYFDTIEKLIDPNSIYSKNYSTLRSLLNKVQEKLDKSQLSQQANPHPTKHHRKPHPHP